MPGLTLEGLLLIRNVAKRNDKVEKKNDSQQTVTYGSRPELTLQCCRRHTQNMRIAGGTFTQNEKAKTTKISPECTPKI